ncbi:MAG TPA: hypothetical protein VG146_09815 [Verrucomicrobiae bacterium]|nr:hypothetical protein [Verrucomicrobiae bacterium]
MPLSGGALSFAMAPVTPGVHDKEQEDHETEGEQDDRGWFVLPESLETSGDFLQIHAELIYTKGGQL